MGKKVEVPVKIGDDEFVFYGDPRIIRFFADAIKLLTKKAHDYSPDDSDHFKPFYVYEYIGLTAEEGILARMQDKLVRIGTILKKGEVAVTDETVYDSLMDLANYAALMAAILKEKEEMVKDGSNK